MNLSIPRTALGGVGLVWAALLGPYAVMDVSAQAGLSIVEAAQITLIEQPAIHARREALRAAEASLQVAAGRFDTRLSGSLDHTRDGSALRQRDIAPAFDTTVTNQTRLVLGLDRQLRSSLLLRPSVTVSRQDLNFDPLAASRASVSVGITQPLWRGRGASVVTAQETAARFEMDASAHEVRGSASGSVYQTVLAYWNYVAAYRNLEIVIASEARARQLVEETRTLIEAGNRPAADIHQANGNLAERMALRASSEQAVFESRQLLGLAMGLPAERAAALPRPSDGFPAYTGDRPPIGDSSLRETALNRRADIAAARARERGTQSVLSAARNALEPQFDLSATVGYSGLTEGNGLATPFSAVLRRLTGPNFIASATVSKWRDNHAARGQLASADAAHRQILIRVEDLTRSILSGVAVAQDTLARSAERARLLQDAAQLYRTAVDNERQKLQLGLSTIIDLVLIEERLTRTLLEEVSASLAYASAVARLRFETSTFITAPAPAFGVTVESLTTVPR